MVMSSYTKKRILILDSQGESVTSIVDCLALEDGVKVSKQGVRNFLKHYAVHGKIDRKPGSGLPSMITPAIKRIIEDAMRRDDETTATQIQSILATYLWRLYFFSYYYTCKASNGLDLQRISVLSTDTSCE